MIVTKANHIDRTSKMYTVNASIYVERPHITELLFQLDSSDEQAAAIRRELDARREKVSEMERVSELFIQTS